MRALGSAVLVFGALMLAFGLFGEVTAPAPAAAPSGVVGVPVAPGGFVLAGAAVVVAGAILLAAGTLAGRLAGLDQALARTQRILGHARPASDGALAAPPAAPPRAPAPEASAYSNDAAGWRKLIGDAEARGWKAATTLTGVHFRNRATGAELHVRRIEEAVEGLGLNAPAPPVGAAPPPMPPAPSIAGGRIAAVPGSRVGAM